MPMKCSCGYTGADDSVYRSKCGRKLILREETLTCGKCSNPNPPHVEFCGRCGETLDPGHAEHVVSVGEIEEPAVSDVYVKYGSPNSLFICGSTEVMTKTQFILRTLMFMIVTIPVGVFLMIETSPLLGLVYILLVLGGWYV